MTLKNKHVILDDEKFYTGRSHLEYTCDLMAIYVLIPTHIIELPTNVLSHYRYQCICTTDTGVLCKHTHTQQQLCSNCIVVGFN